MVKTPNYSTKRCLVLGGRGFIGSHLVERLLGMGYKVRIFDRPSDSGDNAVEFKDSVEIHKGDIVNESALAAALEGVDYVFHLICTTMPKTSNENPVYDVETNLVGTLKLLNLVKDKKGIRFIFTSSGGTVYGIPEKLPISEDHPTRPICSYGICKLTIENYLHTYRHLYGLDYAVLRVSNPYGERQNPRGIQGVIPVFMLKALEGREIEIWGDGRVRRDFIYIGDVIDAFINLMESDSEERIFNIGSGVALTLNEMIDAIKETTGLEPELKYLPARDLDVPVNYLDISLARKELDWEPRTTLKDGLEKTWGWLRAEYSKGEKP